MSEPDPEDLERLKVAFGHIWSSDDLEAILRIHGRLRAAKQHVRELQDGYQGLGRTLGTREDWLSALRENGWDRSRAREVLRARRGKATKMTRQVRDFLAPESRPAPRRPRPRVRATGGKGTIPRAEATRVLEAIGWEGELDGAFFTLERLDALAREAPTNAVFDWRESASDSAETIASIVPDLPEGWAAGARSTQAVIAAAQRARPEVRWKLWEDSAESDAQAYLLVRAAIWRTLEGTWLSRALAGATEEPEPVPEDRGAEVRRVAERTLEELVASEAILFTESPPPEALVADLAAEIRKLYIGNPVLGPILASWLIRREEVSELFDGDAVLAERVNRIWKRVLGRE